MHDKFIKPTLSLIPFYALSPAITSLDIKFSTASSSQVFDLIYSFPLPENLSVMIHGRWMGCDDGSNEQPTGAQPPSSPPFTGSLRLYHGQGLITVVGQLSFLLNNLRFRRLDLMLNHKDDIFLATEFLESCSLTLESLCFRCTLRCTFISCAGPRR